MDVQSFSIVVARCHLLSLVALTPSRWPTRARAMEEDDSTDPRRPRAVSHVPSHAARARRRKKTPWSILGRPIPAAWLSRSRSRTKESSRTRSK